RGQRELRPPHRRPDWSTQYHDGSARRVLGGSLPNVRGSVVIMRCVLLLGMLAVSLSGQYTLYTCMVTSKDYVVGAKLPPSGIFLKAATGEWRHAGYNHPFINALDYDPSDPGTVYVAAGNGLLRLSERGERWKILTGSDVTELQDVSVDRNAPGTIYFSHTAGIRVSHDRGATWSDAGAGLHR